MELKHDKLLTMTIIINPDLIPEKEKQDRESYIRRRNHLLDIMKKTNWNEEEEKPRRRLVVKYIKSPK